METGTSKVEQLYWSIFETAGDGVLILDLETGSVLVANPAACMLHGYAREEFIGLLPAAFIHPDSRHVFNNYLGAFRSGLVFDTRLLHVRRDGTPFHAEWRGTAFTYRDRPCLLGVVRDVSQRIFAEQRLHQRIEARTRQQSTLLEISHTLALSMADQIAITMVNAELCEHARALPALQERQHLAQNLHDAVNQSLFSAGLIAEALPRLWERDPADDLARRQHSCRVYPGRRAGGLCRDQPRRSLRAR
jgi:PAS domain S-box-containing protein